MPRWGKGDDAKLVSLFKTKKLDPTKLDAKSVHKAHVHWPESNFNSFSSTHKHKCNAWNLEQELAGKRKGGKRGEFSIALILVLHKQWQSTHSFVFEQRDQAASERLGRLKILQTTWTRTEVI